MITGLPGAVALAGLPFFRFQGDRHAPTKGPHISISAEYVVNRILRINLDEFERWPQSVRQLAIDIAEELFLVAYNPFISASDVKKSVNEHYQGRVSFSPPTSTPRPSVKASPCSGAAHEAELEFCRELEGRLSSIMPDDCILRRRGALVASATDATDLRMELPLLVVEPDTPEQISALVRLRQTK